jgi:hypothetical protein
MKQALFMFSVLCPLLLLSTVHYGCGQPPLNRKYPKVQTS